MLHKDKLEELYNNIDFQLFRNHLVDYVRLTLTTADENERKLVDEIVDKLESAKTAKEFFKALKSIEFHGVDASVLKLIKGGPNQQFEKGIEGAIEKIQKTHLKNVSDSLEGKAEISAEPTLRLRFFNDALKLNETLKKQASVLNAADEKKKSHNRR